MSPDDFIAKWQVVTLTERASAQEHFIDVCRILGEQTPTEADPTGMRYAFEKGAGKAGGCWKRRHFGWASTLRVAILKAFKELRFFTAAKPRASLIIFALPR